MEKNKKQQPETKEVKKTKTYAFWMSVLSAVLLFIVQVLNIFGVTIQTQVITDIVSSLLGVLVVTGILIGPIKTEDEDSVSDAHGDDDITK